MATREWVNEGRADRVFRVILGVILLSLVVVGPETLWGLIGFIPLLTGLFGFCPAYKLIGTSTCSVDQQLEN